VEEKGGRQDFSVVAGAEAAACFEGSCLVTSSIKWDTGTALRTVRLFESVPNALSPQKALIT